MTSVAVVVPELLPVPPVQGGAVEHWVDAVIRRMAGPGRRLAVVSRPAGIAGPEGVEFIGIPWTPFERLFQSLKNKVTWRNPLRYVAKFQNVFSYGVRAARAVRDFDLIYVQNEPNILLFVRPRAGQRVVLHMHNDHLSSRLFRPLYRRVLARVDTVLCVSDYIRRRAVECFPEYTARFQVVLNATDPEIFKPYGEAALPELSGLVRLEPGCRHLLYAGRLTPVKGVHVLIEAFRDIRRRLPDVRLIVTGSSFFAGAAPTAYEEELAALAAPVREAIVFTGYLPHDKLRYLYSAVDVVVFPSVWPEPFGLVMLEAMASGTCLIASRVGGVPEVVEHGKNGVLVEPDDAQALADAVCDTLGQAPMMRLVEAEGRRCVVGNYTWERLVGDLERALGFSHKISYAANSTT